MRQYGPFLVRTIQHVIVGLALCTAAACGRWQFIAHRAHAAASSDPAARRSLLTARGPALSPAML